MKWAVFLAGISVFAQLYDFQALLGNVTEDFQVSPAKSSFTVSGATFGMALGLLIYAFIADRFSRKRIMTFSLLMTAVITLLTPLVYSFEILLILNLLKGVCVSGVSAVTLAYLSEEVSGESLGVTISFYLAGNTFGGMFGRVVTALFGGWYDWRIAVWVIGGLGLILTLGFIKLFPDSRFFTPEKEAAKTKFTRMKSMLTNSKLMGIYLLAFCLMGGFVSVYNYLGFKLEAAPYYLPHYLIAAIFLMYAFGIMGNMVAGSLSDRYSSKKIIRIALILFVIGVFLMFFSPLVSILLGLTLLTISFFSAHTIAGRLVTEFTPEGKTMATSLYWLFYYIGSSVIGTSTGVFVNNEYWSYFFGALLILGVISLFAGFYSTRKM